MSERTSPRIDRKIGFTKKGALEVGGALFTAALALGPMAGCTEAGSVPTVTRTTPVPEGSYAPDIPSKSPSVEASPETINYDELNRIVSEAAPTLAAEIVAMQRDGVGNYYNSITQGVDSNEKMVQVFVNTSTSLLGGAGKSGEYSLVANMGIKDGKLDPKTVDTIIIGSQVNRDGKESGGDRHNVFDLLLSKSSSGKWEIQTQPSLDTTSLGTTTQAASEQYPTICVRTDAMDTIEIKGGKVFPSSEVVNPGKLTGWLADAKEVLRAARSHQPVAEINS